MDIRKINTGADLIDALRPFRDAGTADYIKEKMKHRENAGYEKNAFSGSFSLPAETGTRDLVSLLLEEVTGIEVSNLTIKETRFGIEKEIVFLKQARMSIEVSTPQKILVLCESKDRRLRSEIEGEFLAPNFPGLEENDFRSLVKSRFLKFNIDREKGIHNWSFNPECDENLEWPNLKNLLSLVEMCKEGNFEITCYLGGRRAASAVAHRRKRPSKKRDDILVAIRCLDELHKNIGFRHAASISINQFYESINRNRGVFYLVGEQKNITVRVHIDSEPSRPHTEGDLLYPFVMYGNSGFICAPLLISANTNVSGTLVVATEISVAIGEVSVAESYEDAINSIKKI